MLYLPTITPPPPKENKLIPSSYFPPIQEETISFFCAVKIAAQGETVAQGEVGNVL